MKTLLIIGAVTGLVAAGVYEGKLTNRWGDSAEVANRASRLQGVPGTFGDWVSTDREMDPNIQRVAGAAGYVDRNYRNTRTGEVMDVLMLSGPSGSIAAHTPDVCYAGIGFAMKEAAPVKRYLDAGAAGSVSYWSARFDKDAPGESPLLVNWAWGVDGDWSASEAPRRDYMLHQSLYKLYVTRRVPLTDRNAVQSAASVESFLKEFVPVVKTALAAPTD